MPSYRWVNDALCGSCPFCCMKLKFSKEIKIQKFIACNEYRSALNVQRRYTGLLDYVSLDPSLPEGVNNYRGFLFVLAFQEIDLYCRCLVFPGLKPCLAGQGPGKLC